MHSQVSARIILPIILIVIGIVLLWKFYKKDLMDPIMLTAAGFLVAGGHGLWLELTAVKGDEGHHEKVHHH